MLIFPIIQIKKKLETKRPNSITMKKFSLPVTAENLNDFEWISNGSRKEGEYDYVRCKVKDCPATCKRHNETGKLVKLRGITITLSLPKSFKSLQKKRSLLN
jgi:hypothetical protein